VDTGANNDIEGFKFAITAPINLILLKVFLGLYQ